MENFKVFTLNEKTFPQESVYNFIQDLHQNGQYIVTILDPGVKVEKNYLPYKRGCESKIWIQSARGGDLIGKVWPGRVVFPDWFHPNIEKWWFHELQTWIEEVPIDGRIFFCRNMM